MREPTLSNAASETGIIVLAAGASTRMGTPKQLLAISGVSLVRRAAQLAIDSKCGPVVVVLGANAEAIRPELVEMEIHIAVNPNWQTGLSASIRCGLEKLLVIAPEIPGVILMLADQPNVTSDSLQKLVRSSSDFELAAARYDNALGTPAFFSRTHFDELLHLVGIGGAKKILQRHRDQVLAIDLPEAALDLDTPEEFASFSEAKQVEV